MSTEKSPDHRSTGTVYVVDADPASRDELVLMLSEHGLSAIGFSSAAQLLAAIGAGDGVSGPDCVVVDATVADVTAVELPERIRSIGRSSGVIILAGRGDIQGAVAAVRGGAVDVIEKPFTDARLLDSVRRILDSPDAR